MVARNCGDATHASPASTTAAQKMMRMVRHFRCSSANTASMIGIVTSAVRDTTTNIMLTTKLSGDRDQQQRQPVLLFARSSVMIGIGQRHRAQREFLALVDVVLDEDAALGPRLERKHRIERTSQDITISSVQDTRKAMNTHRPRVERSK